MVNTSDIGALDRKSGKLASPFGFIGRVTVHPVIQTGPLRVRWVKFVVIESAHFSATPRFGSKGPQDTWPAAFGIFKAVGMQAGEKIGDG